MKPCLDVADRDVELGRDRGECLRIVAEQVEEPPVEAVHLLGHASLLPEHPRRVLVEGPWVRRDSAARNRPPVPLRRTLTNMFGSYGDARTRAESADPAPALRPRFASRNNLSRVVRREDET